MKKFTKEIIILMLQFILFYIYPLLAKDPMGMVSMIIVFTFILSLIMGIVTSNKFKNYYPVIISLLFLPTVYIYYNSSAFIHSLWYFVISFLGLFIGSNITKKSK